jgi:FtsP/CotA-like multicopper oxidase with cupredoxin domain
MIAALLGLLLGCPATGADTVARSSLACLTLYPTPDLAAASGAIALLPPHSPFGVALTVDGRPRHHLVATLAGLPEPRSLGPGYTAYVAWAYTLSLDSATKLGVVHNGRTDLGELALAQFRILISAERSAAVRERQGRLVLRGTSPSARLLAHRDLLQPSAMGALLDTGGAPMAGMHDAALGMPMHGSEWPMPPMPVWMMRMPGMTGLVPRTAPFLPTLDHSEGARRLDESRTTAPPLHDGDTLTIEAGVISRTIAGKTITMYGFDGRSPGPLIEAAQGATIVIRFHDALDVPSSIHWHGVRLDAPYDGAVGLTQEAVPAGGWFTYRVHLPDAGIYWYHPHVREDAQQGLGLYGNLLVRPSSPGYYNPVNREVVLTLDDVLLGADWLTPFGAGAPTHALMGRFGNVFLLNGEAGYSLGVHRGDVVRFFLTNVSSSRFYNVSFGGAPMKVVASDGGKYEHEERVGSIVIAPAERYVVEVAFTRDGTVPILNRVQAIDHMVGAYFPETDTLGVVRVAATPAAARHGAQFATLRDNADVARELAPFREYFDKPIDHSLVLSLETHDLPAAISNMLIGINAAVDWNDGMPMMNWLTTSREITWVLRDPATGKENMDIDWRFHRGDVVKLRVFNDPSTSHAMAHPIHIHGQRFLVLSRDGVRNDNLVWKDTAIIPAGQTVDLLVDMSNPGRWMLHCHIAEHLSAGMMAAFTVE